MDDLHQNNRVLVVDILSMIDEEDQEDNMNSECQISEGIGKSSHRKGARATALYMSNVAMKSKWKIFSH